MEAPATQMPTSTPVVAHPTARHGELRLGFERRGERTVLVEQYSHAPLRVMRPIAHASGAAVVYLLSPTGGVLQGDRCDVSIRVGEHARAVFTTQAATKVYGMEREGAVQTTRIHVEPGGLLEYRPDPLILYAGSDYTQKVDITLAKGARLVYSDVVMPGRLARGERRAFRQFTARLTVRHSGRIALHENFSLRGDDELEGVGVMDDLACWGSWCCLGIDADVETKAVTPSGAAPHRAALGVTRLTDGIAVRALANSAELIERAFADVVDAVYSAALGVDLIDLRKY